MKPVTPFDNYPSFGNAGARQAPGDAKYALGFVAADTFPAEWANYFFHGATKGVSDLNTAVRSIWLELNNILTAYGITADVENESQLLTAIGKIYPKMTTCSTSASTQIKSIAVTGDVLKAGNVYVIDMTYGNTYGDGSSTYPTLSVNSGTDYPICDANGHYLKNGAWAAGDTIKVLFTGTKYLMATRAVEDILERGNMSPVTSNAVSCVFTNNVTPNIINGPILGIGGKVTVLFTADVLGSDTSTPLTLSYNGNTYNIKIAKNGVLSDLYAYDIGIGNYVYIQSYSNIDFIYDGTYLIIAGNPIVIKTTTATIYADGFVYEEKNGDANATSVVDANRKLCYWVKRGNTVQVFCQFTVSPGSGKQTIFRGLPNPARDFVIRLPVIYSSNAEVADFVLEFSANGSVFSIDSGTRGYSTYLNTCFTYVSMD